MPGQPSTTTRQHQTGPRPSELPNLSGSQQEFGLRGAPPSDSLDLHDFKTTAGTLEPIMTMGMLCVIIQACYAMNAV